MTPLRREPEALRREVESPLARKQASLEHCSKAALARLDPGADSHFPG